MRTAPAALDPLIAMFGPVIHAYTRADALADGSLVDVSTDAREAGITIPVAMTRAAWAASVEWTRGDCGQDEKGRLWDVVYMLSRAMRGSKATGRLAFQFYAIPNHGRGRMPRLMTLHAVICGGDDGRGALTIMQKDED